MIRTLNQASHQSVRVYPVGWHGKATPNKKVINTSFALKTMNFMRAFFSIAKKDLRVLCYAHFSCKFRVGFCWWEYFFGAHRMVAAEHYGCVLPNFVFLLFLNILTIISLHTKQLLMMLTMMVSIFRESLTFCGIY